MREMYYRDFADKFFPLSDFRYILVELGRVDAKPSLDGAHHSHVEVGNVVNEVLDGNNEVAIELSVRDLAHVPHLHRRVEYFAKFQEKKSVLSRDILPFIFRQKSK